MSDNIINRRLYDASSSGDVDAVNDAIEAGADVNFSDRHGWSPLCIAAFNGHVDVIRSLVNNEAILDQTDREFTALIFAATQGHMVIVEILISKGADIEYRTKAGDTALTATVGCFRDVHIIKILINNRANIEHKTNDGNTALTNASKYGRLDIVMLLVGQRANIDHKNQEGNTAIAIACVRGHVEIVRFLLSVGADKNIKNSKKLTSKDVARNLDVKKVLEEYNENGEDKLDLLLQRAVRENKLPTAVILLSRGVKVQKLNVSSLEQLLYPVVVQGSSEFVMQFLLKGVNINVTNQDRNTALHLASMHGKEDTVRLLLKFGADKFVKNNKGKTPKNVAKNEAVKGVFDDFKESGENTFSHLLLRAMKEENITTAHFLISKGANVGMKDEDEDTPLHIAASYGNADLFQMLIVNGASYSLCSKNKFGQTPLDLALASKNDGLVKIVLVEFLNFALKNNSIFQTNEFQQFLGEDGNMFHLIHRFEDRSLLKYIVDQGTSMMKERQELLDLMIKIDKFRNSEDLENSQYRIVQQLKFGLESSRGLEECVSSVQERYSWTVMKMWLMRSISFSKNIIFGWSLFLLDFGTDLSFSLEMFKQAILTN